MHLIEQQHFLDQQASVSDNWLSYWQSGVDFVLKGEIVEAQSAWLFPFLTDDSADEIAMNTSLANYLEIAAARQQNLKDTKSTIALRQLLWELMPSNVHNILKLITVWPADEFDINLLSEWSIVELIQDSLLEDIDQDSLCHAINTVLECFQPSEINQVCDFLAASLQKSPNKHTTLSLILYQAFVLSSRHHRATCGMTILEICLANSPENSHLSIQCSLAASAASAGQYIKAIRVAQKCYQSSQVLSTEEQVRASHQLLAVLMEAGHWLEIPATAEAHAQLLERFIQESPKHLINGNAIILSSYFLNYLQDQPRQLHHQRNKIGQIFANNLQPLSAVDNIQESPPKKKGVLRIGYIASTLRNHSVGWLSRWLFVHHDKQQFDIFLYHINQKNDDPFNHHYFRNHAHISSYFDTNVSEIVHQIKKDEVDILIDLDSLSFSTTYEVMCHKPAPVQITWLGWDASGCPAIDYYIADPYVLPPNADEYYSAKIWRLPHTYLAVDGFESDVPSRKRADYNLPEDAVIYLCCQKSYKHHPDILRLQLQIIKSVPNSYLLIKLRNNDSNLIESYQTLLNELEINIDQLRFLERDLDEASHRANLTLADVVLDTFPYNGATTTLETLWMNIPMVTKVGEAFVARNSYAFMKNAGLTEGIAWTDEEYIDWGIRLGTDRELRQQVRGKLLNSRKTSPLWNAQQFTKDMENAYQSMWQKHLEQKN
jgi:predicted O-linked N-acetylglucosamine transferase (SPINDLY family)